MRGKRLVLAVLMATVGASGTAFGADRAEERSLGGWGYDRVYLSFTAPNGTDTQRLVYEGALTSSVNFSCKGRPTIVAGVPESATDVVFDVLPSVTEINLGLCRNWVEPRTEIVPLDDEARIVTLDAVYTLQPKGKGRKAKAPKAPLLLTFKNVTAPGGSTCSSPGFAGKGTVGCLLRLPLG